ncbi:FtsW/RodA/SpoVE family cell cycle protein [Clostridium sp. Marseille-P299]|uniref:FtsW/RodA/SpoVE family cell cycle protein n=1 Tax=Clostridium sp. Marseille-P299 TaxID=1805477 RepID=UPI00083248EE|nr:FtsW/RodA/SpoVE family cell cycle protein [Clostridium sp. Marseille-P299]
MFNFKDYDFKHYNISLLMIIVLLGGIGMVLIQKLQDADEMQFEKQIVGLAVGIVFAVIISLFDYHFLCKFFIPLYIINFILLFLTKFTSIGKSHFQAKRWIKLDFIGSGLEIQTSEFTKIIMILFMAKFFELFRRQINNVWVILASIVLMGMPIFLILIQPNLSYSIVLSATFAAIIFAAGLSYKIILSFIAVVVPVFGVLFWYIQQPFQKILTEYQQLRVLAMLHPEEYPDLVYQQTNAATAIRAGGMVGKFIKDESADLKAAKVPVVESDFIFSAIAEAFGFIGCLVVFLLFIVLIFKCLQIAKRANDYLGMLIATGIASLIMFQVFVNIGVVTSILPNTGVPLPFVSSGLSSLLGSMLMLGVLLNVSLQGKRKEKEVS